MNELRCDICGQFIPFDGTARHTLVEPDNHFGPEAYETTCSKCLARTTAKFPELHGDSLPSERFGAWIVQKVSDGWVYLMSADMTATQRLPVDRFNWYYDEFQKAGTASSH